MKRMTMIVFLIVTISMFSLFADNLKNQEKPQAQNAGRQAKLIEKLRITDEEGDYYFKRLYWLKVGPDGCIYVADDKQFLKFDPEGGFVGNFQKPGEGPGEYNYIRTYWVRDDHILLVAARPYKIVKFDLKGKLLSEKRIKDTMAMQRFLEKYGDHYYYLNAPLDVEKIKDGLGEDKNILYSTTFNDDETDLKLNFPVKRYLHKKSSSNSIMISIQEVGRLSYTIHDEHRAYISNDERYMIKRVDLTTGKITGEFSRKYAPVAYFPNEEEEEEARNNPDTFKPYHPDYFADINALSLYKDKLWVFTSTLDKEKGVLVDLFDLDGKYLDSFYLNLPGIERPDNIRTSQFTIDGDYLYIVERDEEDVATIVKYKIEI